jgi:hypothetical protein
MKRRGFARLVVYGDRNLAEIQDKIVEIQDRGYCILREHFERLSFAKNASADMSLRGNAFITVMQTAELRHLDSPADTRDLPRKRTLLVEAQMGPRSMVVSEI